MTFSKEYNKHSERRDQIDALTELSDKLCEVWKDAKQREAQLAEARLLLTMALDVMKQGTWHPSKQNQVAGIRTSIKRAIG